MMNKIKTNLGQFTALCLFYGLGLFWLYTAYDRIGNLFVTKSRCGTSKPWEWEWWNGFPHILMGLGKH